jgi:hypothetical protein
VAFPLVIAGLSISGLLGPHLAFVHQRVLVAAMTSQAGFADDAKGYRAVVEAESARTAVVAETAAVEE